MLTRALPTPYPEARFLHLPAGHRRLVDRVPFGYEHNLSGLDLFGFEALQSLAEKYHHDYFVASGAPTPETQFYSVRYGVETPAQAIQRLDGGNQRILLKRPEQYDSRYRELMHVLFDQVLAMRGGLLRGEHVVRLDSSILVSSSETITPFHFDPEVSFFFQIEGRKVYHLYSPSALSETELERFYWMGIVNIGQIDLAGRDPEKEYVFELQAGFGMHQPQNSPHWVQTGATRSISYVFSFETNRSRAMGRTRAFNHYQRKAGIAPGAPGSNPRGDALKAAFMRVAIPARQVLGDTVRRFRR